MWAPNYVAKLRASALRAKGLKLLGHIFGFTTLSIRLSEKVSRCRPRETARPRSKADEAQHLIEERLREPAGSRPDHFVFGT